jgi:hypothetical protein
MSSCFSRCLRVPIAIRAFYESYLWILQTLLLTHPDLHPGLLDTKTGVRVDFLKSGIRINDGSRLIGGARYRDPMPIHTATGAGDVAPLPTLIAMKLNAAISGEDTLKLGADAGGRSREEIQKDIADIRELIIIRGLGRSLQLGHDRIQSCYEKLVDEKA